LLRRSRSSAQVVDLDGMIKPDVTQDNIQATVAQVRINLERIDIAARLARASVGR
jgi:hypothetical protein